MSEGYIAIFLKSAFNTGDILPVLSLLFLFLARFLPIIGLSPFFGSRVMPHPVKVVFAFSMFVVFLPQLLTVVTTPLYFNPMLVLLLTKELFVGFAMGFVISIPFTIVQNVGIIIDHQRGGASLMVNDPTIQNQSSPLGTLFNMVLIWIFFMVDGPFLYIEAIVSSYEAIPPDKFFNSSFFAKGSSFWESQVKLFNTMMVISIRLASPALIMILMTDFFLGIANRLAPQVQITFLGMPLKSLLAILIICLGWQLMTAEFGRQCYYWLNQIIEMLKMFKAGSTPLPAG
jgi:type III secretion protein SpaR/YscT/HrcT